MTSGSRRFGDKRFTCVAVQGACSRQQTVFRGAFFPDPFTEVFQSVVDIVRMHAVRALDGTPFWCHPVEPVEEVQPRPLGPHLYSGTLGIAWFLAAASRVLAADDLQELALQALAPLRREIHEI